MLKEHLLSTINVYCNICERITTYELIGTQSCKQGRYLMFNCSICQDTHTLGSLLRLSEEHMAQEEFMRTLDSIASGGLPSMMGGVNLDIFDRK